MSYYTRKQMPLLRFARKHEIHFYFHNIGEFRLKKLKSLGFSANISYALGFLSVVASIVIWFTQGGTDAGETQAAGERFGILVGLWAPTFMAIGNGIDNLSDTR
jgi:hypothetical protein